MITTLLLNRLNTRTTTENRKLTSILFLVKFSYKQQREAQLYFAGNMADAETSTEEERNPENPLDNEDGNLWNVEIWVDINDIRYNKSELKRTIK